MSHVNRVENDLGQQPRAEFAARDDALPVDRVGGEAARVVLAAAVVEIRRRVARAQPNGLVVERGLPANGVVLEDEVAETVEYRLAAVYLDAARDVRPMTEKGVRAGVHAGARESLEKVRRVVARRAALVAVERHQNPVRHSARVPNPLQIVVHIAAVGFGRDAEILSQDESASEKRELRIVVRHHGALRAEAELGGVVGFEAEIAADAAHGVEGGAV